jgi:hypothetical protein
LGPNVLARDASDLSGDEKVVSQGGVMIKPRHAIHNPIHQEFIKQISEMDRCELLREKTMVDTDIVMIESQLHKAISQFKETGERASQSWFDNARLAKRLKGQQSQIIQVKLAAIKQTEESNENEV